MNEQELKTKIDELKSELEPLEKELSQIWKAKSEDVAIRVKNANNGKGDFNLTELRFSAYAKCDCGAGLAYPKDTGAWGSWHCSAILMGSASTEVSHTAPLPFSFYEIKSENQPSAHGASTRPKT